MPSPQPSLSAGLHRLLTDAVAAGEIPGAVARLGRAQRPGAGAGNAAEDPTEDLVICVGVRRYGGPAVTPDTRYDLASLTKVVATLPAVLALVGDGEIALDDPVGRFIASAGWFQQPSLADVTLAQLLRHRSGLPAWRPIFAHAGSRLTAVANALQTPLEQPPGSATVYSDLGFMVLGAVVEAVTGMRLDAFVTERIFAPLGMQATTFGPLAAGPVAATEQCGWRRRLLEGEVHDENAFAFGGVAGHAGLFSTAADLARYARAWLRLDARLAPEAVLRQALLEPAPSDHAPDHAPAEPRRGLGWQLAGPGTTAGRRASPRAFGHTGFTGTSLWCDPDRGAFALLLSNRVHPSRRRGERIDALRLRFHDAAWEVFDA